jgi:hypothetical protein
VSHSEAVIENNSPSVRYSVGVIHLMKEVLIFQSNISYQFLVHSCSLSHLNISILWI